MEVDMEATQKSIEIQETVKELIKGRRLENRIISEITAGSNKYKDSILISRERILPIMKGDEFIKEVLQGERDFSEILLNSVDLATHEGFRDLQGYLVKSDIDRKPFIFDGSNLGKSNLSFLYLPNLQAKGAHLNQTKLIKSCLKGATFYDSCLSFADLSEADLEQVSFNKAYLNRANFYKANLTSADLRGAFNLKDSKNIGYAFFRDTYAGFMDRRRINYRIRKTKGKRFISI